MHPVGVYIVGAQLMTTFAITSTGKINDKMSSVEKIDLVVILMIS